MEGCGLTVVQSVPKESTRWSYQWTSKLPWIGLSMGLLSLTAAWAGWTKWSGDAIIHIILASNIADGHLFQFNPGENSAASSSPGWTLWLAIGIRFLGLATTLILEKIVLAAAMAAIAVMVYRYLKAKGLSFRFTVGLTLLVVLNPGYVMNAPLGMENIVFAAFAVLVLMTSLSPITAFESNRVRVAFSGIVMAGLMILRPEGIMVAVAILAVSLLKLTVDRGSNAEAKTKRWKLGAILGIGFAAYLLVALIQWRATGLFFETTSITSRIMASRRESLSLGPLWFDPAFSLRMVVYFPFLVGIVAGSWVVGRKVLLALRKPVRCSNSTWIQLAQVLVFWGSFFIYSFVSGAPHLARYITFLIPVGSVIAIVGVQELSKMVRPKAYAYFVAVGLLAMASAYGLETILRQKTPGVGGGYSYSELVHANRNRREVTDELLLALTGTTNVEKPIKIALVEVQKRFFVDNRVKIISIDGRTSPVDNPVPFLPNGSVDEVEFLRRYRPDYVLEWIHDVTAWGHPVTQPSTLFDGLAGLRAGQESTVAPGIALIKRDFGFEVSYSE